MMMRVYTFNNTIDSVLEEGVYYSLELHYFLLANKFVSKEFGASLGYDVYFQLVHDNTVSRAADRSIIGGARAIAREKRWNADDDD